MTFIQAPTQNTVASHAPEYSILGKTTKAKRPCRCNGFFIIHDTLFPPSTSCIRPTRLSLLNSKTRHVYLESAMSSILKIIFTVSAANSIALVLTNSGCNTFSSLMSFLTPPLLMLMPAFFWSCACLCLSSVTTLILFKPAFSASVVGMTSMASAKAFQQMASVPESSRARSES